MFLYFQSLTPHPESSLVLNGQTVPLKCKVTYTVLKVSNNFRSKLSATGVWTVFQKRVLRKVSVPFMLLSFHKMKTSVSSFLKDLTADENICQIETILKQIFTFLICHSSKSTGVTNSVRNDSSITFSYPSKHDSSMPIPVPLVNDISDSCAFITCPVVAGYEYIVIMLLITSTHTCF